MRRHRTSRLAYLAAAPVALLLVSGCGSDDGADTAPDSSTITTTATDGASEADHNASETTQKPALTTDPRIDPDGTNASECGAVVTAAAISAGGALASIVTQAFDPSAAETDLALESAVNGAAAIEQMSDHFPDELRDSILDLADAGRVLGETSAAGPPSQEAIDGYGSAGERFGDGISTYIDAHCLDFNDEGCGDVFDEYFAALTRDPNDASVAKFVTMIETGEKAGREPQCTTTDIDPGAAPASVNEANVAGFLEAWNVGGDTSQYMDDELKPTADELVSGWVSYDIDCSDPNGNCRVTFDMGPDLAPVVYDIAMEQRGMLVYFEQYFPDSSI